MVGIDSLPDIALDLAGCGLDNGNARSGLEPFSLTAVYLFLDNGRRLGYCCRCCIRSDEKER